MVGEAGCLSTQSLENCDLVCKYCFKKVINKVKCIKCNDVFHPACLKQSSEKKSGCKHETGKLNGELALSPTEINVSDEKLIKEQNILLRQVIEDKNIIINDKERIISLLNDKIGLLENKLKFSERSNNQQGNQLEDKVQKTVFTKKTDKQNKQRKETTPKEKTAVHLPGNSKLQGDSDILLTGQVVTVDQVNNNLMQIQTKQKCEYYANLVNDEEDHLE